MKKALIAVLVLAVLAAGGWWFMNQDDPKTPSPTTQPQTENNEPTESAPAAEVATVKYNGSNFSASTITVNPGTKVDFTNESSSPMLVASDPHPAHTDFAEFEADRSYVQGETYSFTFTEAGTYGYHNHLNPAATGTVIVK